MNPSEIYALQTKAYDAEYLLQIFDSNDQPLITIGQPAGGHQITRICLWEGTGVDGEGDEQEPLVTWVVNDKNVNQIWKEAVIRAYSEAINRVKIVD